MDLSNILTLTHLLPLKPLYNFPGTHATEPPILPTYVLVLETRLNLTDQQSEKFKPVFFEHREKLQNILKQHGMDLDTGSFEKKIGIRQLRAIKKDMDRLNRSTDNQLAGILNKEQIKEYKKIQERQRDDLRDRLMNRR